MKKNDKIFLIVFLAIVSFSLLYLFQASYAKYRKQVTGEIHTTVASWNIKVNNENINNKTTLTTTITPTLDSDPYIKTGVIAPGSTGHFTLTIDPSLVDVDFTYQIESSPDTQTPLYDLKFSRYTLNGVSHTFQQGSEGIITGDLVKNSSTQTIVVYFEWDDNPSTNTMDNEDDTSYAINPSYTNTKIKVQIHFTQKRSSS
jgi:hypothetical protein